MFSKDTKASIGIALAYLSFIVGAGFTTGQELLQFSLITVIMVILRQYLQGLS